jgi:hypothetical protein
MRVDPFPSRKEIPLINPEKRCEPRLAMQIPMRYRSLDLGGHKELPTDTQNISHTGLFMRSSDPLKIGSAIFLNLRVPREISGSVFSEIQCTGRVVHERRLSDGQFGYGVQFDRMISPAEISAARSSHSNQVLL